MPDADATTVDTSAGPARVQISAGEGGVGLLVLTHGSAGSVDAPDLRALRDAAAGAGWTVAAVTQPFRLAGARAPGSAVKQDAAWVEVVTALRATVPGPLVQAGRSNGARVACRTADPLGAAGVVALAFPVHPPGRPEKHRLDELDLPTCRVLVVQGSRDPFGVPSPRRGRRTVVVVDGADHALKGAAPVITREARRFLRAVAARPS
ncbi:alpha/beta hydrolase family protein [Jatrophihabitans sp. YIM 134969]